MRNLTIWLRRSPGGVRGHLQQLTASAPPSVALAPDSRRLSSAGWQAIALQLPLLARKGLPAPP